MNFNTHFELAGKHAFLSASKYSWIRYDLLKLEDVYRNHQEAQRGTELHEFAANAIRLGIKLPRTKKTINAFVNDALGFRMTPEQILYYSSNVFGTTDAISFRQNMLRIHDLKNGVTKASFDQLLIYAALFCLEYRVDPSTIDIELRLYQENEVRELVPDLDDILLIMQKIVDFDKRIEELKLAAFA